MNVRRLVIAGASLLLLFLVVAGVGLWYFFLRSSSPPPVSLQAALTAAAPTTGPPATGTTITGATGTSGTWSVVSDGSSFAGYRVNENLVGIGANTAVGRTPSIEGTLVFDGSSITNVHITADLAALKSDKSQRDGALRMQALETSRYPTATFDLTTPIPIDGTPQDGVTATKTVQGNLTLHGITRPLSMSVQSQLKSGRVVVVGSININFSDFSISPPSSFSVLSVDDHGTMEFQLVFAKAA